MIREPCGNPRLYWHEPRTTARSGHGGITRPCSVSHAERARFPLMRPLARRDVAAEPAVAAPPLTQLARIPCTAQRPPVPPTDIPRLRPAICPGQPRLCPVTRRAPRA